MCAYTCLCAKCKEVKMASGSHHPAGAPVDQAFVSLFRVRCPECVLAAVQQPGQSLNQSQSNCRSVGGSDSQLPVVRALHVEGVLGGQQRGILPAWTPPPPSPICQALARATVCGPAPPGTDSLPGEKNTASLKEQKRIDCWLFTVNYFNLVL